MASEQPAAADSRTALNRIFDRARHAQNCASFGPDSIDYRQLGEDLLLVLEALDLVDAPCGEAARAYIERHAD